MSDGKSTECCTALSQLVTLHDAGSGAAEIEARCRSRSGPVVRRPDDLHLVNLIDTSLVVTLIVHKWTKGPSETQTCVG